MPSSVAVKLYSSLDWYKSPPQSHCSIKPEGKWCAEMCASFNLPCASSSIFSAMSELGLWCTLMSELMSAALVPLFTVLVILSQTSLFRTYVDDPGQACHSCQKTINAQVRKFRCLENCVRCLKRSHLEILLPLSQDFTWLCLGLGEICGRERFWHRVQIICSE